MFVKVYGQECYKINIDKASGEVKPFEELSPNSYLLYYLYNDREEKKLLDSIIIHKISIDTLFIYEQTKYIEIYVCNKDGNKYSINPIMLDINKNSYYDAYSIWNDKLYKITQHITQTSLFSSININIKEYYPLAE